MIEVPRCACCSLLISRLPLAKPLPFLLLEPAPPALTIASCLGKFRACAAASCAPLSALAPFSYSWLPIDPQKEITARAVLETQNYASQNGAYFE